MTKPEHTFEAELTSGEHHNQSDADSYYEHIFDEIPAVVFVVEVTEDGGFVIGAMNRMQREMVSAVKAVKAVVGGRVDEVFPQEMAQQIIPRYQECVRRGESIEYEEYAPHPVNRHFLTSLRPVKDPSGRIIRIIGATRDITEKKKMEEQIRNSQEIQYLLLSKIPDMILIHIDGKITYVNDSVSKITGYTPDEAIGRSIYEFMAPDEAARVERIDSGRSRKESVPETYTAEIIHKSGDRVNVEIRGLVVEIGGKEARMAVITDVSERVKNQKFEERFRNLAEMLPETIYETDLEGTITYVNRAGISMFGYTPEDLTRKINLRTAFPSEEWGNLMAHRAQTIESNKINRIEYNAVKKDGTRMPVIIHTVPIVENGKTLGTRGIIIDITESKRAEESLITNERRLETLVKISKMSVSSMKLLTDYIIVESMSLTSSVSGFLCMINHGESIIELTAWRKTDERTPGTASHRAVYPLEMRGIWSAALASRVPVIINDAADLPSNGSLPGGFHPRRRHLQVPVYYRDRIVAIAGVSDKREDYGDSDARQMTLLMNEIYRMVQQKSRDKEISDEKEKLDATLRSIADGVITINGAGIITMFNAAAEKITGWSSYEAMGEKIADVVSVFSDRSTDRPGEIIGRIRENALPQAVRNRLEITRKDGRRIPVEIHINPISEADRGLSGEVLVVSDVSEKRQYEDAALRASKLDSVGILAGGIAHDFNNILTSILGNISLSQDTPGIPTDAEMFLKDAEKAVVRAKGLTQQLLTLSKGGDPVKSASSIGELIREAAELALRGSNVRCEYEMADDIPVIEIDGGQIMQVINNLVINSMQAMPGGGIVRIKGEMISLEEENPLLLPGGGYIRISVSDTGVGIPSEFLPRIFDPYFTTKERGHGLGLATTYSIVMKHGGHIEAESSSSGTTITFHLPARVAEKRTGKQDRRKSAPEGTRILVLEDDPTISSFLEKFFEINHYRGVFTADGRDTITRYKTDMETGERFDLVMIDLTIPGGLGGKDTIAELRKIDPGIKAIVCSGYSNDSVMADYRAYGFSGRITKPYLIDDLNAVFREVLAG